MNDQLAVTAVVFWVIAVISWVVCGVAFDSYSWKAGRIAMGIAIPFSVVALIFTMLAIWMPA